MIDGMKLKKKKRLIQYYREWFLVSWLQLFVTNIRTILKSITQLRWWLVYIHILYRCAYTYSLYSQLLFAFETLSSSDAHVFFMHSGACTRTFESRAMRTRRYSFALLKVYHLNIRPYNWIRRTGLSIKTCTLQRDALYYYYNLKIYISTTLEFYVVRKLQHAVVMLFLMTWLLELYRG